MNVWVRLHRFDVWKSAAAGFCAAVLAFGCAASLAADWYVTPHLYLKQSYDTNILVTEKDKLDDFITNLRPEVEAVYRTERFRTSWNSYAELLKYIQESDLDTVIHDHQASVAYAINPRLNVRAQGFFRKDKTLETELLEEGLRANRQGRRRFGGDAGVSYAWSPVLSTSLSAGRSYIRYSGDPDDKSNMWTDSLDLVSRYVLTPKASAGLTLGYDRSRYDNLEGPVSSLVDRSIQNVLVLPTFQYRFREDLHGEVGLGYRKTWFEQKQDVKPPFDQIAPDSREKDTFDGFLALFMLQKDWQRGLLRLNLSRDQYSTLEGESVERNRFVLSGRYRVTARLTGAGSLDYVRTKGDRQGADADYLSVRPNFTFQVMPNMGLTGFLNYLLYDSDTTDTDRWITGLTLTFSWDRLWSGS